MKKSAVKGLVAVSLVTVGSLIVSATRLTIRNNGKTVGSAGYSLDLSNGKVSKTIHMIFQSNGPEVKTFDTTVYSDSGTPISDDYLTKTGGKQLHTFVHFDSNGANITADINGQIIKKTVPLPKGVSTANPSNVWFIKKTPHLHEMVVTEKFDSQTLKWSTHTITYRGDQTIEIGGKKYLAHRLYEVEKDGSQEIWVDSSGQLLKYVSGPVVMERI